MKRITRILLTVATLVAPLVGAHPVLAASATMSLSPGSTSVVKGATLTINVYENSGAEPVNAATAHLTYPTDKFDFISISSSSAFSIVAANSGGGGSVQIERGALPAVSGNQLVASVRLKAKLDSGSASVGLSGSVISANSNSNILAGANGGNYTFKAPAPAAPAAPTPAADTAAPTISDVKASDVTLSSAVITWKTSEPATSEVVYGLDQNYGLAASDGNRVTDHRVVLNSTNMIPGTDYHFMVKSVDAAGNAVSSADTTFTTQGVTLTVTVVNEKNKPVAGAKVTFGDVTVITDKDGKASVTGLSLGKQNGTVEYKHKTTAVKADIKLANIKNPSQLASYKVKTPSNLPYLLALGVILIVFALAWKGRHGGGPFGGIGTKLSTFKSKAKLKGRASSKEASDPSIIKPTSPPQQ